LELTTNEKISPAFFFIPDISGFTKFVNETELLHSKHIISELLNIIIDSDEMNLSISEIEGDAVLFYKMGEAPTLKQIAAQSKRTFIKFHEHLRLYERDRICQCGACSSANELSVKFIIHYGHAANIEIGDQKKLMGADVVLAHKVLKNDISSDEYVLITNNYFQAHPDKSVNSNQNWVSWKNGANEYEGIGKIDYSFYLLSALHSEVGEPPKRELFKKSKNPVSNKILINGSVKKIHSVVSDVALKTHLSNGNVKTVYDEAVIQRVGSSHKCITPKQSLDFKVTDNKVSDERAEFAEALTNNFFLKGMTFYSVIEHRGNGQSQLTSEVHYSNIGLLGRVLGIFIRPSIKKSVKEAQQAIKIYIESK